MAREISHPIRRVTRLLVDGEPLMVSLEPGDMLGMKLKRGRKTHYISLAEIWNKFVSPQSHVSPVQVVTPGPSPDGGARMREEQRALKDTELPYYSKLISRVLSGSGPLNYQQIKARLETEAKHGIEAPVLKDLLKVLTENEKIRYKPGFKWELVESGKGRGKRDASKN